MDCRFEDAAKMQNFLTKVQQLDDSIAVTLSMQENISFAPIFSAVIAVITSVIVALLGGLLPAIKAAKLEPALALR